ncbi:hypothetical protein Tco_1451039 [Tanacetum coccineum]
MAREEVVTPLLLPPPSINHPPLILMMMMMGMAKGSTPSPIRFVNSLTNNVPQVFQNPPNIDPHMEPFYTRQTEIINRQVQIQDEHRGGLRSIGKGLGNL